nr:winged helix-turn-helix domain-containing protein [Comamonas thiooxydans]
MLDAHIDGRAATPAALPVAATASLGWQPMRSSAVGLVEQLVEHFGGLIRNHGLRVGVRLPSVRALAESAGVSRDTVVQAYDKLAAQGLVQSRRGSGFYVAAQRRVMEPAAVAAASAQPADFDTAYLLRGIFRDDSAGTGGRAVCLRAGWIKA